ncbi:MAG TPA: hypothetical protein QGF05_10050 [Dehalococcoidia bacterium]|nr:hypothetical protein [Dehalococcoidia bacterium]
MRWLFALILVCATMAPLAAQEEASEQVFDQDKDVVTGPEVGEQIPNFRARDQNGEWQDFESIRGPSGAVVVFHRSADW